jgi:hypothetical protein
VSLPGQAPDQRESQQRGQDRRGEDQAGRVRPQGSLEGGEPGHGNREVVGTADGDGLHQGQDHGDQDGGPQRPGQGPVGQEQERDQGAQQRDEQEGSRSLDTFSATGEGVGQRPAAFPDQGRRGIGEDEIEQRRGVQEKIAAGQVEEQGNGHGEVERARRPPIHTVQNPAQAGVQGPGEPDRGQLQQDGQRQDRNRPETVEQPGKGQGHQAAAQVHQFAHPLGIRVADPLVPAQTEHQTQGAQQRQGDAQSWIDGMRIHEECLLLEKWIVQASISSTTKSP